MNAIVEQAKEFQVPDHMPPARFQYTPRTKIRFAADNYRKRFVQLTLTELAKSITKLGIAQPLLIRPIQPTPDAPDVQYEVVFGERRLRGADIAGLADIPTMVRDLTDEQAKELRLLENIHRENPHPLEEALAFKDLIDQHGYSAERLADQLGHEPGHVVRRLKLCELPQEVQELMFRDENPLGVTVAMKLTQISVPELRIKAAKDVMRPHFHGEPMSARAAINHINQRYMLQLATAPFDSADPGLLPAAGSCAACPKRTGNQPQLFADIACADTCTDPNCFAEKRIEWSKREIARAEEKGRKVVKGKDAGKIFPHGGSYTSGGYVKPTERNDNDPKRRTWGQLAKAAGVEATLVQHPETKDLIPLVRTDAVRPHFRELGVSVSSLSPHQRQEMERAKTETEFRTELFRQAFDQVRQDGVTLDDWRMICARMVFRLDSNDRRRLAGLINWEKDDLVGCTFDRVQKKTIALEMNELGIVMFAAAMVGEIHSATYSNAKPENLLAAAKRRRIDPAAVRARLKADEKARAKEKAQKTAAKVSTKKQPKKSGTKAGPAQMKGKASVAKNAPASRKASLATGEAGGQPPVVRKSAQVAARSD